MSAEQLALLPFKAVAIISIALTVATYVYLRRRYRFATPEVIAQRDKAVDKDLDGMREEIRFNKIAIGVLQTEMTQLQTTTTDCSEHAAVRKLHESQLARLEKAMDELGAHDRRLGVIQAELSSLANAYEHTRGDVSSIGEHVAQVATSVAELTGELRSLVTTLKNGGRKD